ncbi:hypothetical protein E3N88_06831 [Mikania micrantha]|uniref:Uncharacterized protein n=1 Tax=Mikania micrantha TaxID=192012 RepID=A0A5N6PRW4_9ASTR|nr:hypothetical protein E3N88_06831 [Mikania micrantha]
MNSFLVRSRDFGKRLVLVLEPWNPRGRRGQRLPAGTPLHHPCGDEISGYKAPAPLISLVKHIFRTHMLKILLVRRRRRPESCQSCWHRMAKQTLPIESSRREEKDGVEIGGWRRRGSP